VTIARDAVLVTCPTLYVQGGTTGGRNAGRTVTMHGSTHCGRCTVISDTLYELTRFRDELLNAVAGQESSTLDVQFTCTEESFDALIDALNFATGALSGVYVTRAGREREGGDE
jgi:hypothetical protein